MKVRIKEKKDIPIKVFNDTWNDIGEMDCYFGKIVEVEDTPTNNVYVPYQCHQMLNGRWIFPIESFDIVQDHNRNGANEVVSVSEGAIHEV